MLPVDQARCVPSCPCHSNYGAQPRTVLHSVRENAKQTHTPRRCAAGTMREEGSTVPWHALPSALDVLCARCINNRLQMVHFILLIHYGCALLNQLSVPPLRYDSTKGCGVNARRLARRLLRASFARDTGPLYLSLSLSRCFSPLAGPLSVAHETAFGQRLTQVAAKAVARRAARKDAAGLCQCRAHMCCRPAGVDRRVRIDT